MHVNNCIPSKTVKIGPRDPSYITPVVKLLLEKRRRLRRKGHLEEAGKIADRINVMISKHRESCLKKLADATPKKLWATVNKHKHNKVNAAAINGINLNPNVLNQYFASVATDLMYDVSVYHLSRQEDNDAVFTLYDYQIEPILRKVKNTAFGLDNLPAWLFCLFG